MPETNLSEEFVNELQKALRYLYEPSVLRKSPLTGLLKNADSEDPSTQLRRLLIEAIQSLKPGAKVPQDSNSWRTYQVLTYRFVEQITQKEVATDLALSIRQLRRLENAAVIDLAETLRVRFPNGHFFKPPFSEAVEPGKQFETSLNNQLGEQQELEWLKNSFVREAVVLPELMHTTIHTISSLAKGAGVKLETIIPANLPQVLGQVTTLRQVLLNMLTAAIRRTNGGEVWAQASELEDWVYIDVWGTGDQTPQSSELDIHENLDISRKLAKLSGGSFELAAIDRKTPIRIRLGLKKAERIVVLVIDDNLDALLLMERYLADSRYHFVGVRDPSQALTRINEAHPNIIILDVMLPGIDGWELLGQLREHPTFGKVPLIISTILPQEALAMTLGANGFIRKPFSQETCLKVLDQLVVLSEIGSR